MANRRTHLLVGVGVAATLDVLWQHSCMGKDSNRQFDWGEFVAVSACGACFGILPDLLEPAIHPHHRGFFHSVAFVLITIWAFTKFSVKLTALGVGFCVIMALCYCSHLLLDLFTPRSLPFIGRWRC